MTSIAASVLALAVLTASCREPDRPTGPGKPGLIAVFSDPAGARILVDGRDTGFLTPDTLTDLEAGRYEIAASKDTAGVAYRFVTNVRSSPDTVLHVLGPLLRRCTLTDCVGFLQGNNIQFALRPVPSVFFFQGQGVGLFWPAGVGNSYASIGAPVVAGVADHQSGLDTLALGPYDVDFFAGRPALVTDPAPDRFVARLPSWVLPPTEVILANLPAPRGLQVDEEVVAGQSGEAEDILFLRLKIKNISADTLYRTTDPEVGDLTWGDFWAGFALDFDVGVSEDDLVAYVPELDLAIGYDSDFMESDFEQPWDEAPGLVGLRLLEAPAEAPRVVLNTWERELDWSALSANQAFGHLWLSGTQETLGNHPDAGIGYVPDLPADVRMSVAAGPLTLAPGDSLSYTLAVIMADPVPGTFTSGTVVPSGDPFDPNRTILRVARTLVDRAEEAAAVWQSLGSN